MFSRVRKIIGCAASFFGLIWLSAIATADDMAMDMDLYTPVGFVLVKAIFGLVALIIGAVLLGGGNSESKSES